MRRRFIISCICATLFLGGWGSALAAVVCSHAGTLAGVAECCRRKQAAGESGHGAGAAHSSHGQHGQHGQTTPAPASNQHDSHSSDQHDSHGAPVEESIAGPRAGVKVAAQVGGAGPCAHCVERPTNLPPSDAPRSKNSRGGDNVTPQAHAGLDSVAPNTQPFAPPVTPKQGSPPSPPASRRHLLLGVFLI